MKSSTLREASIKQWFFLILILTSAVFIRVYTIQQEPLIFHPVKQYRSAMTARAIYYEVFNDDTVPKWKIDVANANTRDMGVLQPPVQSWIAAYLYRIAGGEFLWLPRLFSALSWIIGGIFLFLLACQLMSLDAALVSLSFYLLLPFSVTASQSFQIDPVMVTITIVGLYTLVRYDQSQSLSMLIIAAIITSVATLLKPISLIILVAAFIGLNICKISLYQIILSKRTFLFIGISLLPSAIYYGNGILFVGGALQQQAVKSFVPIFFTEFRFWDGWQKRVRSIMGFTYLLGALIGTLISYGRTRTLLVALWAGYFLMCLAFNYTISTHDYYHLILIPIVALSIGAPANLILAELQKLDNWYWKVGSLAVLAVAIILAAGTSIQAYRRNEVANTSINLAQEIGNTINHSTKTIYLAPEQGHSLLYYGEFSGRYWPYRYDIRDERMWLGYSISVKDRFEALQMAIEPEYFIVTDFVEFAAQPELKQFVASQFPIFMETEEYIIFSLEK